MTTVIELRKKIDKISLQIVELLLDRRVIADQLIAEKCRRQEDIWDPEREKELMELLTKTLSDSEKEYIEEVFKTIFVCTRGQK